MSREPSLQPFHEMPAPAASLVSDLRTLMGYEGVSVDPRHRVDAGSDMWPKALLWRRQGLLPRPPDVVLFPKDAEQVAKIMVFAGERGIPIVPVGGRSGVCGGIVPLREGTIAMDARRMSWLFPVDAERLEATFGAGVLGEDLERHLVGHGTTLGHFPASIAFSSVGGWLATRSGGQSSSRYGKIEDMVVGMECVLGTGEIVRPRRPVEGMDWIDLFTGSEGTFGFITEATFRIWPLPERSIPRAWRFPSLKAGLSAMREILQSGNRPSVMRLYDPFDSTLSLRRDEAKKPSPPPGRDELQPLEYKPFPLRFAWNVAFAQPLAINFLAGALKSSLLLLLHEGEGWEAEAEAREVSAICKKWSGEDRGEGPAKRWKATRWDISRKMPTVFELGGWVDTMEVAIGWGKVHHLYRSIKRAVSPYAFAMTHFSHAYEDGCCLYFTFIGAAKDVERGLERYDATWAAALEAAKKAGATITHHHGVGLLKTASLQDEVGQKGADVLHTLKQVCDPKGILNPGKLVG